MQDKRRICSPIRELGVIADKMKLNNKLIDIDFLPNRDLLYSGYCIKQNRQILILVNYDTRAKTFDGYSVFRPKEITKFRIWTPAEIRKIKTDNRKTSQSVLTLENEFILFHIKIVRQWNFNIIFHRQFKGRILCCKNYWFNKGHSNFETH
ncbi:MAG: hypothetical protein JWO32_748 [Bacteroidetes bacterium]|nr:hypothetical protein [Bacteroidota bacterium]